MSASKILKTGKAKEKIRHRGMIVLMLGLAGVVMNPVPGVIALFMANRDLRLMKEGRMDDSGRRLTLIGKIAGIIATCIGAMLTVALVIYIYILATEGPDALR